MVMDPFGPPLIGGFTELSITTKHGFGAAKKDDDKYKYIFIIKKSKKEKKKK